MLSHEIAHALAHHVSERIARERTSGGGLLSLSYDRQQELEADHIGVFLMTFAGYDPDQAVAFWQEMEQATGRRGSLPEILSDHPSDEHRMRQLKDDWVPKAVSAAKKAYDKGRIEPARAAAVNHSTAKRSLNHGRSCHGFEWRAIWAAVDFQPRGPADPGWAVGAAAC